MSPESYDGIVIGAGHNGLITAAYLAKAGLRIAVFERRPTVGGGFATEELTAPGFKHNIHAIHCKLHEGPVHRDLALDQYGVSYAFPEPKMAFVRHEDYFVYYQGTKRNVQTISRISQKDAKTYASVSEQWRRWYLDFILPELYSAPLPPDQWEEKLRRRSGGAAYLSAIQDFSPLEYACDLFESDFCRMSVLRAVASAEYSPVTKGIPPLVFAHIVNWFAGNTALIKGGSRTAAEGLARVIDENGGRVFVNQSVGQIIVRDGTARGIVLENGRQVQAERFVASSIDPVHTFLFMIGEKELPDGVANHAASFQFKETSIFRVHLALRGRPHFKMAEREPDIDNAWKLTIGYENLDDLLAMGREAEGGLIPELRGLDGGLISVHDNSQAPAGHCTAYVGIPAPFELADGGAARWPDVAGATAERLLEKLREYAPNVSGDVIVGKFAYSPKDIEEYLPNMVNGDICQGKITADQLGALRPWEGLANYRTPIDKLYLCGASTHPGGHALGGSGYNAANKIAEDLGVDKWWPRYNPRDVVREA